MSQAADAPSREEPYGPLFRGIALVAFATLLFEISLIRILSFTIWYHFAYVVISTALLGFGAAGTLVAVRPAIGTRNLRGSLALFSLFAALAVVITPVLVGLVPLHPMRIFENPGQLATMIFYQLLSTIPFFFAGLVISLSLRTGIARVGRMYFWDLVGGGVGCASAVALMNWLSPPGAAVLAGAAFAAASAVYASRLSVRALALLLAIAAFAGASQVDRIPFETAESKHLSMHMSIKGQGMDRIFMRWTALFRTDVVAKLDESKGKPFSRADEWGISRQAPGTVSPPYGFITHDGSAGTSFYDLREGPLEHLEIHSVRVPYEVVAPSPNVLVIGVGGGRDVIAALYFGARRVTGVELDPVTIEVIQDEFNDLADGFFRRPDINLVASEGRHFVRRSSERYDLIQITGVDTLAAQSSGAYVLAESYLYSIEAFGDYLDALTGDGLLSVITGDVVMARSRSAARMVSVARAALLERGVKDPGRHIAVINSGFLFVNLLVKPDPFTPEQTARLAGLSRELGFDPLYLPGSGGHPLFEGLVEKSGAARRALLDSHPFVVEAITDDSPFFFRFYRWRDLIDSGEWGPVHTTALGQLVLVILLVSLTVLGAVFVLLPLVFFKRHGISGNLRQTMGMLVYFLALGLGFMLFEISLMQSFVLYLGYPTYSLSVVLFALLTFLGLGSYLSARWIGRERVVLPVGVAILAVLTVLYMTVLPWIQDLTLRAPLFARVLITVLVLSPLGLTMGMYFPLGLRRAAEIHEDLVPWAWGINGCASVTGTVLAVVLAMNTGFRAVWMLSVAIYAVGVFAMLWVAGGRAARG